MDELIINTWKQLVFENHVLTTNEIIEKIQVKFNIAYSDVIKAISKELDKKLTC